MEEQKTLGNLKRERKSQLFTDEKGREWSVTPTSPAIRESRAQAGVGMVVVATKLSQEDAARWVKMAADLGLTSYSLAQRLLLKGLARHENEQAIRKGWRGAWR